MQKAEAKELLGFPPSFHPTPSEVKAAYKRKAWESHPDRVPPHEKLCAETKFKMISEAYLYLKAGDAEGSVIQVNRADFGKLAVSTRIDINQGTGREGSAQAYTRVVRTGVPNVRGGKSNPVLIKAPFLLIILGTIALGGINATRAYQRQKDAYPSHNPFLP